MVKKGRTVTQTGNSPQPARRDSASPDDRINILLVDDEPKNLTVLESILDDPGFRLIKAASADEALLALVAEEEFGLLILDIQMPDMNGFELAQMIRKRKKTAGVPIIFLTAYYNEDQHVLEGYGTGAVDYLHKPVNPAILRSKVAVFAELYRKNRSLLAEVASRLKVEAQLREMNATLEQRVSDRTQEVRQNQRRLLQAADAAQLTYIEVDFPSGTARAGPNFGAVMGYTLSTAEQFSVSILTRTLLEHVVAEDRNRVQAALQQLIEGKPVPKIEYRVLGDDWTECWIESQWSVECDSDGSPLKAFGTHLDITTHKHAEVQFRRVNADLEQFAYSASHDLREPLRNVAIYSQLFQRNYGSNLDERGTTFLGYIVEGAQRMGSLLGDLLKYTQALAVDSEPVAPTDTGKVLQQVLVDLQHMVEESNATITYDSLPIVSVHEVHLHQLLQNLIENALKYRQDNESPRVHISGIRDQGMWQISVQDNGIGIDPAYQSQVFGIFKRLHPKGGKYPGTGVGLAICQKIIERYGGRIWIESEADSGATFHFTIPAPLGEPLG